MNISVRAVESGKIIRWLRELEENPLNYYQVELADDSSGKGGLKEQVQHLM